MLPRNSPKGVRNLVKVVYVDRPDLIKDYIQPGDLNSPEMGPEILNDPIFRQSCANYGYAAIQIGDRLVRVYCKPPDKVSLTQETPGQQPSAFVGIQPGTDPRVEMSTQDNAELDRNALWEGREKTKALLKTLYKHKLVGGKWVPTPGEIGEEQRPTGRQEPPSGARPYNRGADGFLEPGTKIALREDMWHVVVRDNGESIDAREIGPWSRAQGRRSDMLLNPDDITHTWTEGGAGTYEAPKRRGRHYDPRTGMRVPSERRILQEEDFTTEHPIAKLGTSGPKGPHVTAMWFVKTDDSIYLFTSDVTQKIANIKRDPRVSVLVDTYNPKDVGDVDSRMFYGRAELYERGTPEWEKGVKLILEKYRETEFEEDEEQKIWLAGEDPESKPLVIKIPIAETVIPTDKHKLVGGKWVPTPGEGGLPSERYGKTIVTFSGNVEEIPRQAIKTAYEKIPTKVRNLVKSIVVTEEPGKDFKAGGQNFSEGGNWDRSTGTITIVNANNQSIEHLQNELVPHESAHAVWSDVLRKSREDVAGSTMAEHHVVNFSTASMKEGGVSEYAKSWLKEDWRPGTNENFAEMTAIMMSDDETKKLDTRFNYPLTYNAWRAIALKYDIKVPSEKLPGVKF